MIAGPDSVARGVEASIAGPIHSVGSSIGSISAAPWLVACLADDRLRLVVHSPSPQVLRILTVTGLMGNRPVFESRGEALAGSRLDH
jgi:hypothetical protein